MGGLLAGAIWAPVDGIMAPLMINGYVSGGDIYLVLHTVKDKAKGIIPPGPLAGEYATDMLCKSDVATNWHPLDLRPQTV